jgi:hypothetical protein
MNIGVKEAKKIDNFDCFIFHDVDLMFIIILFKINF